jgi:hypothetical protein
MTRTNVVAIGLGLGKLLEVENFGESGMIYCSYLRILVEIDVRKPLNPGFLHDREGGNHLWCQLKYERLGDDCVQCGFIGHKKQAYTAVKVSELVEHHKVPLFASSFSSFSLFSPPQAVKEIEEKASPLVLELENPLSAHSQVSRSNSKPRFYLPHACSSLAKHTNDALVTHTAQCSHLHQPLSSNDAQTSTSATIEKVCPIILPSPPSLLLNAPNKITYAFLENATTINA